MKKSACLLVFSLLLALPALAQSSQFGFLLGGSKRLSSEQDVIAGIDVKNRWQFGNSVKEIFYSVEIEPGTQFKLKAGQIVGPGAFRVNFTQGQNPQVQLGRVDLADTRTDHIDALIDYRFSEAFGSTGIFAGVGYYRAHGTFGPTTGPVTVNAEDRSASETNYGLSGGINGDFPISRRYGVVVEATYHWVNYHYRPRYITVTGGLRFAF
ncbi:MAG TPA: hypothetical protein VJ276_00325 [Thermoanaerobaculia bacterium]|nr:hypothetical protein [Thermoanaerobaculia bacterium]